MARATAFQSELDVLFFGRDAQDVGGQLGGQPDGVDAAGGDGAAGHGVELRRLGQLRQRQATLRLDGLQSERSVGCPWAP